jgi:hypothetical protein
MAGASPQTWPLPPPSVSKKAWAHATPLMLQVLWCCWRDDIVHTLSAQLLAMPLLCPLLRV